MTGNCLIAFHFYAAYRYTLYFTASLKNSHPFSFIIFHRVTLQNLVQKIVRVIKDDQLISPGARIVVGTSGGADSTALLHILANAGLDFHLTAVYVNHRLRPEEARREHEFVSLLSADLNVAYCTREVDVKAYAGKHGLSEEESARTLRYQVFKEICRESNSSVIAVGHTANDQVEEFFIRLIRGTGLKGLSGMSNKHGRVVRPLLTVSRDEVINYLNTHSLSYCHDSSNDDTRYLRNRVRHNLLPFLEHDYNPSIKNTILQTSSILACEEDLLEQLTNDIFSATCSIRKSPAEPAAVEISCNLELYRASHPALQRRVVEKICWTLGSKPSYRQVTKIQQMLINGESEQRQHLQSGLRMHLERQNARFFHPMGKGSIRGDAPPTTCITYHWEIDRCGEYRFEGLNRLLQVSLSDARDISQLDNMTLAVDADQVHFPLVVRTPTAGEKFLALGAPGRKKIARILSDAKIPQPQRPSVLLVEHQGGPVVLLGHTVAEDYKVTDNTARLLLFTWKSLPRVEVEDEPSDSPLD